MLIFLTFFSFLVYLLLSGRPNKNNILYHFDKLFKIGGSYILWIFLPSDSSIANLNSATYKFVFLISTTRRVEMIWFENFAKKGHIYDIKYSW